MRIKVDPKGTEYEGVDYRSSSPTIADIVCFTLGVQVFGNEIPNGTWILDLSTNRLLGMSRDQVLTGIRKLGVKAEEIAA